MTKEFEDLVKEKLEELDKEEVSEDNTSQEEQQIGDETTENGGDDSGEETKDESFTANDLSDFLKKTETKLTVKKEGCMPSPIFGTRDSGKNHNKYRIYVSNPKGKISFIFWDSIINTEKNVPLEEMEALKSFAMDLEAIEEAPSFEEFKNLFGYGETDEQLAQKSFNGCRKQLDKAKKMFTEPQLKELKRLATDE